MSKCNYPECDGGPATGYCHTDCKPADSPFIEGTQVQFAWDSTALGWAKTCPRLYQYCMIEGYRPKDESIHLRFGIEYHQALQEYDVAMSKGARREDAVHTVVRNLLYRCKDYPEIDEDAKPSARAKTKHNLVRTVVWYLDHFEEDNAKTWVKRDGKPAVEQSFRFALDYGPKASTAYRHHSTEEADIVADHSYILCGHLDRIVNFNHDLYVMDRKTTYSTPSSYYFDRYEPDNQMSLYTFAGQVILNTPIRGVIIDVAQVTIEFSRFVRGITYRTKDQLDEWRRDLRDVLNRFEAYAIEGYWPQNDTACDKYGGCRFRDVCSRSPNVRQAFLDADFVRQPWNPLDIR